MPLLIYSLMGEKKLKNQEILIRNLSKIVPEKIYDFKRKTIFSPLVTGNNNLMFALVEGEYLAKSQNHIHPGDEVTLTMSGKAEITINNKKYSILPQTAIRVPPWQIHPLVVTSKETWIALAAYCDNCSLLKEKNKNIIKDSKSNIIKDTSRVKFENKNNLKIKSIFSPYITDVGYLNFSIIKIHYINNGNSQKYCNFGENIFLTLSGIVEVETKTKRYLLAPERAILISSEQNISLRVVNKEPWIGINISCKNCPLLKIKINKKNKLSYKEKQI